ncbi:hypothetical protein RE431_07595 [Christiangramia sp. SM2212]|uniref:Uncharacterized protein n=2 Tax=Christiangramia sediminicola TaxID=3073267 RepID=A0ABU1EQ34_9FLAO|nr:hypothetical protein [Christiangramia sp. SM2212]
MFSALAGCQREELDINFAEKPSKIENIAYSISQNKSSQDGIAIGMYTSIEQAINNCTDYTINPYEVNSSNIDGAINPDIGLGSYYGLRFRDVSPDNSGIKFTIRSSQGEVVYEKISYNTSYEWVIFAANQLVFINASPVIPGPHIDLTSFFRSTCEFNQTADTDGDGIYDDLDPVVNSNYESTIIIDECDSGIDNFEFGDGYTFADKVDELENDEYKNHGQFVKIVSQYLNDLIEEGFITEADKNSLMACTGSSDI